jgi:hypothetical protein
MVVCQNAAAVVRALTLSDVPAFAGASSGAQADSRNRPLGRRYVAAWFAIVARLFARMVGSSVPDVCPSGIGVNVK